MNGSAFTYTLIRGLRGQRVLTLLLASVSAALAIALMLVLGRTNATLLNLIELMNDANSRTYEFVDADDSDLINENALHITQSLSPIEAALVSSVPFDVVPGFADQTSARLPAWSVAGDLSYFFELESGRWPEAGEAIVDASQLDSLRFDGPAGALKDAADREYPVVGTYTIVASAGGVGEGGVLVATSPGTQYLSLTLVGAQGGETDITATIVGILQPDSPTSLKVSEPESFEDLRSDVLGNATNNGRAIVIGAVVAVVVVQTLVVGGNTLLRRSSIGRQRALGASRSLVVSLIVGQVLLASAAGSAVATLTVGVIMARANLAVDAKFAGATICLAVCASVLAALPPSLLAANRDPLLVLRSP